MNKNGPIIIIEDDLDDQDTTRMYRVPREMGILKMVPYTEGISTSEIRRRLQRGNQT